MAYLKSFEQARKIEWDKNHLWDIRIPDSPFPDWFPATDVQFNQMTVSSFDVPGTYQNYKIPIGRSASDFTLTIPEDIKGKIYAWLEKWYNDIYYNPKGILPVAQAVKKVYLAKLDVYRELREVYTLDVYPDGSLGWHRTSSSEIPTISVSFVVARMSKE